MSGEAGHLLLQIGVTEGPSLEPSVATVDWLGRAGGIRQNLTPVQFGVNLQSPTMVRRATSTGHLSRVFPPHLTAVRTASGELAASDGGTTFPKLRPTPRPYSNVFFGSFSPKVPELEGEGCSLPKRFQPLPKASQLIDAHDRQKRDYYRSSCCQKGCYCEDQQLFLQLLLLFSV